MEIGAEASKPTSGPLQHVQHAQDKFRDALSKRHTRAVCDQDFSKDAHKSRGAEGKCCDFSKPQHNHRKLPSDLDPNLSFNGIYYLYAFESIGRPPSQTSQLGSHPVARVFYPNDKGPTSTKLLQTPKASTMLLFTLTAHNAQRSPSAATKKRQEAVLRICC